MSQPEDDKTEWQPVATIPQNTIVQVKGEGWYSLEAIVEGSKLSCQGLSVKGPTGPHGAGSLASITHWRPRSHARVYLDG